MLVLQSLNCIKVGAYIDDGYTGTNFNRPGIQQLLGAVWRGEVSCIIVKDLSRFGRKYLEVSKYLEQLFPCIGVRFIAIGDGYDSDTHKGTTANLDVPIRNMLNALYSKKVSKDVKLAKQSQIQEGKYIHALAPFGYKKDPTNKHRLIIDEPTAKVVKQIFELFCNGKTPKQIADILNFEGIPTPSGYKMKNGNKLKVGNRGNSIWINTTVNNILRNQQYTGVLIGGKTEIAELGTNKLIHNPKDKWIITPNTHPAIITQEMWELSESQKNKNKTKHSGKIKRKNTSRILYKRVRCGYCGHVFRLQTSLNRNYYTCTTLNYTNKYGCTQAKYYEDEIINVIKTVVRLHINTIFDFKRLSTTLKHAPKQNTSSIHSQSTIDRLTREIKQLQSSKRLLYERYKKGSLDITTYHKERESVDKKIYNKTLEYKTLSSCNIKQEKTLNQARFLIAFDFFTQFQVQIQNPIQIKDEPYAEIINNLVESVFIFDRDRIEIKYSFDDPNFFGIT